MTGHVCILDTAGSWEQSDRQQLARSDWRRFGILQSQDYGQTAAGPREWTLRWSPATAGIADRIQQHFEANRTTSFDIHPPGGEDVAVIYAGQPRYRRRSAVAYDVQLTVRETHARRH